MGGGRVAVAAGRGAHTCTPTEVTNPTQGRRLFCVPVTKTPERSQRPAVLHTRAMRLMRPP